MNCSRFARLLALSTVVSAAAGCAGLFGIHELDPGDDGGQSDGALPPPDATTDSAARGDATTDSTAPRDASAGDGEASLDAQTGADAPSMADASDAPSCVDRCAAGSTQCSAKEVQTCQVGDAGCRDWVTTSTCGTYQACAVTGDAGASCACNGTICSETGSVCQDNQTVATCAKDTASGCFYVASTSPCAPMVCSGLAPNAMCSSTCTNSCTQQGLKSCVPGGLATCEAGDAGCLAYGPPVACGANQSCTGSAGSGSCTCTPPSGCSTTGNTCQAGNSSYVTCATDSDQCLVVTGTTPCSGGACYGAAGSAQCCTNACSTPGSSCNGNTPVTCSAGANGCLQKTTGTPCDGGATCSGGSCVAPACNGNVGSCPSGQCCSNGPNTCVAASNATCPTPGSGYCTACASGSGGAVCLGSTGCGCHLQSDCAGYALGDACLSGGVCGCNSTSDCPTAGNCCDTQIHACRGQDEINQASTEVCTNGTWYPIGSLGAACGSTTTACSSPYCCDVAIDAGAAYYTCVSSPTCTIGVVPVCGTTGYACCSGACDPGTCQSGTCM